MAQHKSKLKPGELSPDFKYEDSKGKVHSLSELRGKYVLIDFWASYCQPCKEELPCWKELIRKFKKEKIAFVTISHRLLSRRLVGSPKEGETREFKFNY